MFAAALLGLPFGATFGAPAATRSIRCIQSSVRHAANNHLAGGRELAWSRAHPWFRATQLVGLAVLP